MPQQITPDEPVELKPVDDHPQVDHPDEITEGEAYEGLTVYQAVDDLDDDSTGDPLGQLQDQELDQ